MFCGIYNLSEFTTVKYMFLDKPKRLGILRTSESEASMKYLKPHELLKVLAEAKRHGVRELAMFCLAYHHGLRASEICKLLLTDIKDGAIDVRRLKNSLHTIQPLKSHDNPWLDEKRVLSA